MIFQGTDDLAQSCFPDREQIAEVIRLHQDVSRGESRDRSVEMLRRVGIPSPETRVKDYRTRMSGGMRNA